MDGQSRRGDSDPISGDGCADVPGGIFWRESHHLDWDLDDLGNSSANGPSISTHMPSDPEDH